MKKRSQLDALAASTLATKLKAPIILAGHNVLDSQVSLDLYQRNWISKNHNFLRKEENCCTSFYFTYQ